MHRYCGLLLLLVIVGCGLDREVAETTPLDQTTPVEQKTASKTSAEAVSIEDPSVAAAVEAMAANVRRDGDGAIIDVDLRGQSISPGDLEPLTALNRLRALRLAGTEVTDDMLTTVGKIASLEDLDLRNCPISDAGLAELTSLAKLKALRLSGENGACSVSDEGMKHVAELENLKVLAVDMLWISEEGLKKLSPLGNLQELYMKQTTIGNDAVGLIATQFPNLRKLRLAQNQIDAAGVAQLPEIENLEELDLSECAQILDDAMPPMANLDKLKKLNLWRVNITDEGIKPLQNLTRLESLNLDNTRLSDQGMPYLSDLTQLTFLHLGSTQITDEGLQQLTDLKNLKDLRVTRTAVTEDGVAELKQALPEAEIQLKYIAGE